MKINLFLPFIPLYPVGGVKIMFEYANQFSNKGHDVHIYSLSISDYFKYKYPHCLLIIRNRLKYYHYKPDWFNLNNNIKCTTIPLLKDKYVRNADISMSTCWTCVFPLSCLSSCKGKKINLIQDYETWIADNITKLHESYNLPVNHVVISDYLADIVEKYSGRKPFIVYNAIDSDRFYIKTNIKNRNNSISMLYSEEERKGSKYGLEALKIVKKEIPDLCVKLFGIFPKPLDLEDWIEYFQKPEDLCSLYNSTAVYFTPSNGEGWALPPAEAMFCGCALVCTDIGGHSAYAKNGITALTVHTKNIDDMADKLIFLLKNKEKRIELAEIGNSFIQQFNWEIASNKMLKIFNEV